MTSQFIGQVIVLKSATHGTYVSGSGGIDSEANTRDSISAAEEFLVEEQPDGKCKLKNNSSNYYLHCTHDGKVIFVETIGDEEKAVWKILEVPEQPGKFKLQSRWTSILEVKAEGKVEMENKSLTKEDALLEIEESPNLFNGKVVTIKAQDGKYVSGRGGEESEVQVSKDNGAKERFLVEVAGDGKCSLKVVSEKLFLHATSDNKCIMVPKIGNEEKAVWKFRRSDDGKYNIVSRWSTCLRYDAGNGKIEHVRADLIGEESKFEIIAQS